ncbi:unnamed protein product, partial [Rotaria sp. Silwood2]
RLSYPLADCRIMSSDLHFNQTSREQVTTGVDGSNILIVSPREKDESSASRSKPISRKQLADDIHDSNLIIVIPPVKDESSDCRSKQPSCKSIKNSLKDVLLLVSQKESTTSDTRDIKKKDEMFVEVPRHGGLGGDMVKKIMKRISMTLNNAIK